MKKYKIIELFDKFSIETLDSLKILLDYVGTSNETKAIYNCVYNNKFEKVRDEHEGINEYDYITRLLNFNVEEIKKKIDELNKDEIVFLNKLFHNTLKKISCERLTSDDEKLEWQLLPSIGECLDLTNNQLENISRLEKLFSRYTYNELGFLNYVIGFATEHDTKLVLRIVNELKEQKTERSINNKTFNNSYININGIINKNSKLSLEDQEFLCELIDDSDDYISFFNDGNLDRVISSVSRLSDSLHEQIDNKKYVKKSNL